MSNILGLTDSEQLRDNWSLNARRQVFHQYPNGAAPLMGLLSLMDSEGSDKAEFGWEEKRFQTFQTTLAGTGAFTDTSGANGAAGTAKTAAGWGEASGTVIRVKLADVSVLQERDVLLFRNVPGTSSSEKTFQGIVTAVYQTPKTVDLEVTSTIADVLNGASVDGVDVIMVGSAATEGARSKTGFVIFPEDIYNYTQIFRHSFHFTRTALQAGLKFDSSGTYKEAAKDNSLKHMKALEYAALFGDRTKSTSVTNEDGEATVRRTMGGILWYLKQWELGNTGNNGAFNYRPNGADISTADWKTTDDKRIIDVNGTCTKDEFNDFILERVFRHTNDASFEKLVLCGGGVLSAFNKFVDRESLRTIKMKGEGTYGMDVTSWDSPFGTLHFKVHPLLNQTPAYRDSAFILDCGELKYTPLNGADTDLYKNRQPRDYDGRKDEWLTEYGLEVRFPENHMFIDRLTGITS